MILARESSAHKGEHCSCSYVDEPSCSFREQCSRIHDEAVDQEAIDQEAGDHDPPPRRRCRPRRPAHRGTVDRPGRPRHRRLPLRSQHGHRRRRAPRARRLRCRRPRPRHRGSSRPLQLREPRRLHAVGAHLAPARRSTAHRGRTHRGDLRHHREPVPVRPGRRAHAPRPAGRCHRPQGSAPRHAVGRCPRRTRRRSDPDRRGARLGLRRPWDRRERARHARAAGGAARTGGVDGRSHGPAAHLHGRARRRPDPRRRRRGRERPRPHVDRAEQRAADAAAGAHRRARRGGEACGAGAADARGTVPRRRARVADAPRAGRDVLPVDRAVRRGRRGDPGALRHRTDPVGRVCRRTAAGAA